MSPPQQVTFCPVSGNTGHRYPDQEESLSPGMFPLTYAGRWGQVRFPGAVSCPARASHVPPRAACCVSFPHTGGSHCTARLLSISHSCQLTDTLSPLSRHSQSHSHCRAGVSEFKLPEFVGENTSRLSGSHTDDFRSTPLSFPRHVFARASCASVTPTGHPGLRPDDRSWRTPPRRPQRSAARQRHSAC